MILAGFHPAMVLFCGGVNLVYQFWIHTEAIGKMPRWFEAVMNTPSHHRVHHGRNARYLDANYAGVFIIWDKLFGTFVPEQGSREARLRPCAEPWHVQSFARGLPRMDGPVARCGPAGPEACVNVWLMPLPRRAGAMTDPAIHQPKSSESTLPAIPKTPARLVSSEVAAPVRSGAAEGTLVTTHSPAAFQATSPTNAASPF